MAYHHHPLHLPSTFRPAHGPADHDLHSGLLEEDGPVHHDPLPALPRNFRCGRLGIGVQCCRGSGCGVCMAAGRWVPERVGCTPLVLLLFMQLHAPPT